MTRIHIQVNPETGRVLYYPWELLKKIGEEIILEGPQLQPLTAREMAARYAKKRGWKIKSERLSSYSVKIVRVA